MSVASLTTIAAARETATAPLTKRAVGKVPSGHTQADDAAQLTDVLAKQVPTEFIAPYTALSAAIVGAVAKPTSKNLHPDQLATYRWVAFGLLIGFVFLFVWLGTARKASRAWWKYFPVLAVTGALVAAVGWAFALPASPLIPYIQSKTAQTLIPIFVAFGAIALASLTAAGLTNPKS
jgi:hypothetical protein